MTFDLQQLISAREGENFKLHQRFINPQMPRVLKTIGFDRYYVRGEGCYLYDAAGRRTQMVDQTGYTVSYSYNSLGQLSGLTDGSGDLVDEKRVHRDCGLVQQDAPLGAEATTGGNLVGLTEKVRHRGCSRFVHSMAHVEAQAHFAGNHEQSQVPTRMRHELLQVQHATRALQRAKGAPSHFRIGDANHATAFGAE